MSMQQNISTLTKVETEPERLLAGKVAINMKHRALRQVCLGVTATVALLSALWICPTSADAFTVSELDFTSGSIALKSGSATIASRNFTTSGQIVMEQYQPLPDIIAPISINVPLLGTHTFSLFTSGPNPFPSGNTSGSTITADLTSLFAKLTGGLIPVGGLTTNIGGSAIGSFNSLTNAFTGLTWSHGLSGVPGLPSNLTVQFTLNGTAQLAAVPLPGAALLFGSGLAGLLLRRARKVLS